MKERIRQKTIRVGMNCQDLGVGFQGMLKRVKRVIGFFGVSKSTNPKFLYFAIRKANHRTEGLDQWRDPID